MGQVPQKTGLDYLVIGNGRMARHFCNYLSLSNIPYTTWNRNEPLAELSLKLKSCTYYFVLISDQAIADFLSSLKLSSDQIGFHFSGALEIDGLISCHPLMTFSQELYDLETYQKIPFMFTNANWNFQKIFPQLKNKSFHIPLEQKAFYHTLCVMAANFPQILWEKVNSEFRKMNLPSEALESYLQQTVKNFLLNPDKSLTGPLARRDEITISKNLKSLEGDSYQIIYQAFIETFKKEGRL